MLSTITLREEVGMLVVAMLSMGVARAGDADAATDAVLVGSATLGGELVGLLAGGLTGGVGALLLCDLGETEPCSGAFAAGGLAVGGVGGGVGGAMLASRPADVHGGRVARASLVPGAVGAGVAIVGLVIEPGGVLTGIGTGIGLIGMPIAAAAAAASDPGRADEDEVARWRITPALGPDRAGLDVVGRF
jgi:hypothetical protein